MSNDRHDSRSKPPVDDEGLSRREWEQLPLEPDLSEELGYDWADLDVVPTEGESNQVVVLPMDEEMMREDAFVVAADADVKDVVDHR